MSSNVPVITILFLVFSGRSFVTIEWWLLQCFPCLVIRRYRIMR